MRVKPRTGHTRIIKLEAVGCVAARAAPCAAGRRFSFGGHPCSSAPSLQSMPRSPHDGLLEGVLRLLGCDRPPADQGVKTAPVQPIKVYMDLDQHLVQRQREFRRLRKTSRDTSHKSLQNLGVVIDFLQRRIDVKFEFSLWPRRGTIDSFEEVYHHVTFDDGTMHWFKLELNASLDKGHAQQMLRDEDGTFSEGGSRRVIWLI